MQQRKLIALRRISGSLNKGDIFSANAYQAASLIAVGSAKYVEEAEASVEASAAATPASAPPVAEAAAPPAEGAETPPDRKPRKRNRRGRYERRDVRAVD